jgi:hypothetical protein
MQEAADFTESVTNQVGCDPIPPGCEVRTRPFPIEEERVDTQSSPKTGVAPEPSLPDRPFHLIKRRVRHDHCTHTGQLKDTVNQLIVPLILEPAPDTW